MRFANDPGQAYNAATEKDFESATPESQKEFLGSLQGGDAVRIQASPQIATSISRSSDGHIQCFFANFAGLKGGVNPVQTPQSGVQVTMHVEIRGERILSAIHGIRAGSERSAERRFGIVHAADHHQGGGVLD